MPTVIAEVYSRIARLRSPEVADRYAGTILDACGLVATDENGAAVAGAHDAELKSSVEGFPNGRRLRPRGGAIPRGPRGDGRPALRGG